MPASSPQQSACRVVSGVAPSWTGPNSEAGATERELASVLADAAPLREWLSAAELRPGAASRADVREIREDLAALTRREVALRLAIGDAPSGSLAPEPSPEPTAPSPGGGVGGRQAIERLIALTDRALASDDLTRSEAMSLSDLLCASDMPGLPDALLRVRAAQFIKLQRLVHRDRECFYRRYPGPGAVMVFGHPEPRADEGGPVVTTDRWRSMRVLATLGLPPHIRQGGCISHRDWTGRSRL